MSTPHSAPSAHRGRGRPRRGRPAGHAHPQPPATHAPAAATSATVPPGSVRFRDFSSLSPQLLSSIPFEFCTEVQAATLPSIIDNHDVLAQAKTGTGKTLAFLVPSIQRLLNQPAAPAAGHTSVLVLSPTRELAAQIGAAAEGLLKGGSYAVKCVVGGTNMDRDVRDLKNGRADVLVATPGRLVDLIENGGIRPRFAQLRTLVLDEADRLLDQGFRRELLKILEAMPDRKAVPRQTLLFSATIPGEVHSIASIALSMDHKFISTLKDEDVNAHEHVVQEVLCVPARDLMPAAVEVLRREEAEAGARGGFKVMVFLPTARAAALHHDVFSALAPGYPVWEIHSRMSQPQRTRATDAFTAAERGVLFSSDVTARGIDIKGVTAVVQIGLPSSAEQYVHRLGRTARAGAKGHGVLLLADFETFFLSDRTMRTFTLHPYPAPSAGALDGARAAVDSALAAVPEDAKAQAYQAWLGYYNSSLRALKWTQAELVRHANAYARDALHTASAAETGTGTGTGTGEWVAPGLLAKTVGKMGLRGVPGINVVRDLPGKSEGGRGQGGGRGHGGGGGGAVPGSGGVKRPRDGGEGSRGGLGGGRGGLGGRGSGRGSGRGRSRGRGGA
ncbi:hypothetical protein Q5752_004896 [Cryptotrichosporon argae]